MYQTVVIPTLNRALTLEATLVRLSEQSTVVDWDVIVVDNGSQDRTRETVAQMATSYPVPLAYLLQEKPGAAAARNLGWRAATGGSVIFLDDDILVGEDTIARARSHENCRPGTWLVGPVEMPPNMVESPFGRFLHDPGPLGEVRQVGWYASGIAQVPRAHLEQLCGYNESYTTAALEDADLFLRAREAEFEVWFDPSWRALHASWDEFSISDYCDRAALHSATTALLYRDFGEDHPWGEMMRSSIRVPDDPLRSVLIKQCRAVIGSPAVRQLLIPGVKAIERAWPASPLLPLLYRGLIAGAITTGVRRGFADHGISFRPA